MNYLVTVQYHCKNDYTGHVYTQRSIEKATTRNRAERNAIVKLQSQRGAAVLSVDVRSEGEEA